MIPLESKTVSLLSTSGRPDRKVDADSHLGPRNRPIHLSTSVIPTSSLVRLYLSPDSPLTCRWLTLAIQP